MNRRKLIVASGALIGVAGLSALYWPNRWRYIVIHHSAGDFATIEFLQKVHRERQAGDPVDAIPYHYVIGNGNGLGLGEIASDWRRDLDVWGTHVSENNISKNFLGIGICLVGNFEESEVPGPQFNALVTLTKSLMGRYDIPLENMAGHGMIEGENTKCPGRKFPMDELRSAIA